MVTGDSFYTVSYSYRLGRSTVCEACRVIVNRFMKEVMPEPSEEQWKAIAEDLGLSGIS
jgi:hypothetical protein